MNTKFDQLSTRIETRDRKAEAAESLAKQNQNHISNLTNETTALQKKLVEKAKKRHKLEENIEDQVNRNSRDTLVIRGKKGKSRENLDYNITCALQFSLRIVWWNLIQFLSDIERALRADYKNPNSPIYKKFISLKVSQAVLDSLIRVNRSRQTNISVSRKYSSSKKNEQIVNN